MNSGETEQEIVVARRSGQRKNIFCLETYSWFKRFDHRLEDGLLYRERRQFFRR